MWIFGYGSLMWRPGFEYAERQPARLEAAVGRRFWQASPDHRGTPQAPGRVVTLVPVDGRGRSEGGGVDGVAYRLEGDRATVLAALDHRERAGYARQRRPVRLAGGARVDAVYYWATAVNPNFRPCDDLDAIAHIIAERRGPSGTNRDYLFRLADFLRDHALVDAHVFALEGRVRDLLGSRAPGGRP